MPGQDFKGSAFRPRFEKCHKGCRASNSAPHILFLPGWFAITCCSPWFTGYWPWLFTDINLNSQPSTPPQSQDQIESYDQKYLHLQVEDFELVGDDPYAAIKAPMGSLRVVFGRISEIASFVLICLIATAAAQEPGSKPLPRGPLEKYDNPPALLRRINVSPRNDLAVRRVHQSSG